jgi:predicted ferric reductase
MKNIGIAITYLLGFLPILIWAGVRQGTPMFSDFATTTHSLGQISGLVGMSLLCLSLVLATRWKFVEFLFDGCGNTLRFHHSIGIISFVLVLFHPILLVVKFIYINPILGLKYLLPSSTWSVNYGIISIILLIALIILSVLAKMEYNNWKFSHKFMAVVFIFACLHSFLVTTDITFYPALRNYMIAIAIIGGVSIFYTGFWKTLIVNKLLCKNNEQ